MVHLYFFLVKGTVGCVAKVLEFAVPNGSFLQGFSARVVFLFRALDKRMVLSQAESFPQL